MRNPQPVPAPKKPDNVGPFGFTPVSLILPSRATQAPAHPRPVIAAAAREGSSLQAQHVRLDV